MNWTWPVNYNARLSACTARAGQTSQTLQEKCRNEECRVKKSSAAVMSPFEYMKAKGQPITTSDTNQQPSGLDLSPKHHRTTSEKSLQSVQGSGSLQFVRANGLTWKNCVKVDYLLSCNRLRSGNRPKSTTTLFEIRFVTNPKRRGYLDAY